MMTAERSRHGWRRLVPVFALALFVGCSSSAGRVAEPTPTSTPESEATPAPTTARALTVTADVDTVRAGKFDYGKMWTFEYAPLQYFHEEYGFDPDSAWFAKARLGALRIQGCSASFVSPNGLVMTNHHCARENVVEVSQPGEDLLDNGFYAENLEDERPVEQQRADQLIAIVDVTDEIQNAVAGAASGAERARLLEQAEEEARARIAGEYGGADSSIVVEVIELWDGGKYSAYVFQRYTNLRLVMAPELDISFFGGDDDNFTYPRYNLDVSFYRIYGDDGEPLKSDDYFKFAEDGVEEGDAVFVIGNPGGSSRLQTVAQLEWRRAVRDKVIAQLLESRVAALRAFYDENPEEAEAMNLRNQIFSLSNSEKAYRGQWNGLQNPEYMARRWDAERQFIAAIEADPKLAAEYGGLIDSMAVIQQQRMQYADEFGAFIAIGSPALTSAVVQRGFAAYQYLSAKQAGAPETALTQIKDQLLSVADQPASLQEKLLTARLMDFERYLDPDSEIRLEVFQGRTPEQAADAILSHSVLADSTSTADALESGTLTTEDPAAKVVAAIIEPIRQYQIALQQLGQEEAALTAALGQARFNIYGTKIPPDATFSLRIADGVVMGYPYNGTVAPPYTTFYGLFDRHYSFGQDSFWALPERWLNLPADFDLATQLDFVMTADVIGGNSGSPVINKDLEVVGLVFDGNIESLPGDYIYDPALNRSVAVDARGILEALDKVYDADRIVLELTVGKLVQTEEEADAVLAGR